MLVMSANSNSSKQHLHRLAKPHQLHPIKVSDISAFLFLVQSCIISLSLTIVLHVSLSSSIRIGWVCFCPMRDLHCAGSIAQPYSQFDALLNQMVQFSCQKNLRALSCDQLITDFCSVPVDGILDIYRT